MQNLNLSPVTMNTNNNDIINVILASQKKAKEEIQIQNDSTKTVINNETFFTDNLPEGIMSKEDFLKMTSTASEAQLKAISSLSKAMTENKKINTTDFAYTDKQGKEYYFIKLYGRNGGTEFKILSFPGLDKLMQGYLFNIYKVNVSLEELYTEAMTA